MTDVPRENGLAVVERQSLSLVRPIASPKELIEAHKEFAKIINEVLEEGKDYGTIPGTKTPTLFKPGAERLLASAGCRPKYTLVSQECDHNHAVTWRKRKKVWNNARQGDKTFRWDIEEGESLGLYRYVYKCEIIRIDTGAVIGEGDGSCSTMESKYVESPRDYENTIVKMATKRSLIAATLGAFGLSNRFTQDMEDIKDNEAAAQTAQEQKKASVYTGTQDQQQKVQKILEGENVPQERWNDIHEAMMGKVSTDLYAIINSTRSKELS